MLCSAIKGKQVFTHWLVSWKQIEQWQNSANSNKTATLEMKAMHGHILSAQGHGITADVNLLDVLTSVKNQITSKT